MSPDNVLVDMRTGVDTFTPAQYSKRHTSMSSTRISETRAMTKIVLDLLLESLSDVNP